MTINGDTQELSEDLDFTVASSGEEEDPIALPIAYTALTNAATAQATADAAQASADAAYRPGNESVYYPNAFGILTTNATHAAILNSTADKISASQWIVITNQSFTGLYDPEACTNYLFVGCSWLQTDAGPLDTVLFYPTTGLDYKTPHAVFIDCNIRNTAGGDIIAAWEVGVSYPRFTINTYDCIF